MVVYKKSIKESSLEVEANKSTKSIRETLGVLSQLNSLPGHSKSRKLKRKAKGALVITGSQINKSSKLR